MHNNYSNTYLHMFTCEDYDATVKIPYNNNNNNDNNICI